MSGDMQRSLADFAGSAVNFQVARDTPIEQLCELVGTLGKGHGDLLFIEVRLPTREHLVSRSGEG
jgi:hypothetical protein